MTRRHPHPFVALVALVAVPFVWLGLGAIGLAAFVLLVIAALALIVAVFVWPWHFVGLFGVGVILAASFLLPLWILIGIEKLFKRGKA